MSDGHPNMRLRLITLAAVGIAFMGGCAEDSPTSTDPYGTKISTKAVVITGSEGISLYDIIGSTYIFRLTGHAPDIEKGSIIVGTEEGGYIREALSVDRVDNRLIVETKAASLTDAVYSGRTDTLIHFGSFQTVVNDSRSSSRMSSRGAPIGSSGSIRLNLSGLTLYSGMRGGVTVDVTILEGSIEFDPELSVGIGIRDRTIEEFQAIAEGTIVIDTDVSVYVTGEIDLSYEIPIVSVRQTVVHHIGSIPIVEDIELIFSAGFVLSSRSAGSYLTKCAGDYRTRIGSSFGGGAWTGVGTCGTEFTSHEFIYVTPSDISLTVYVRPQLNVVFYSTDSCRMALKPFHGFAVQTSTPPDWHYEAYGGISGSVENAIETLDLGMPDFSASPIDYRKILESGPYATDDYIFIHEWGSEGTGDEQFGFPKGIALGPGDVMYVVDHWNHRVQKFDHGGVFLTKWGQEGGDDGSFSFPKRVAVGPGGDIYVTDSENFRVQKFLPDGTHVSSWGNQGNGDGEFIDPEGIAVDDYGNIYVTDFQRNIVQKFESNGTFITAWGGPGSGEGRFSGVMGIAVGADGSVYVCECRGTRIQRFTPNGDFLLAWGTHGAENGQFDCPFDVSVDSEGNVYVADYGNDRIQKFTAGGVFIAALGGSGSGSGEFNRPEGVAVDAAGNVYVADSRNHRIQKFAPINR